MNQLNSTTGLRLIVLVLLLGIITCPPVFADFKIILKNGSEFIVDDYKELDGNIKFMKMGGEIEIDKANIEDIIEIKAKTKSYVPEMEKQEESITEKQITDEKEKASSARSAAAESRLREIAKRKTELKAEGDKLTAEKQKLESEISGRGQVIYLREEREFKRRISEIEEKINVFNEEIRRLDQEQESLLKDLGQQ